MHIAPARAVASAENTTSHTTASFVSFVWLLSPNLKTRFNFGCDGSFWMNQKVLERRLSEKARHRKK
jgi:hypothetical protein